MWERRVAIPKSFTFSINRIWVVQWLEPGGVQSGRQLYEKTIRPRREDAIFVDAKSRDECLDALGRFATECETGGVKPFLHLDTHGTEYGIAPSAEPEEHIAWVELLDDLKRANIASRNNLWVTVAACRGITLGRFLAEDARDEAPMRGVLGTNGEPPFYAFNPAMRDFYATLLDTHDADGAVSAARAHVDDFGALVAERLFARGFDDYLKKDWTEARVSALVEDRVRAALEENGALDPIVVAAEVREAIARTLEQKYEAYKRKYLMTERYDELEAQFAEIVWR